MNELTHPVPRHEMATPGAISEDALAFIEAATADNTRRAYAAGWAHFAGWCEARGLTPLPAEESTVANYCAEMAEAFKIATIRQRLSIISQAHEAKGLNSPTRSRLVRSTVRGIARTNGSAPRKVEPLRTAHLQAIAARLDREGTPEAKRDKALLLVGFAAALRRSELGAIRVEDLSFENGHGVKIAIPRSKTDPEGEGQAVAIKCGHNPATCPVRSLKSWLEAGGIAAGPVFRGFRKGGALRDGGLSGEAIRAIIRSRLAEVLGPEEAEKFSGHSLRRGFVTQGVEGGASERGLMKTTRHKSLPVFRGYIEDASLWDANETDKLGL